MINAIGQQEHCRKSFYGGKGYNLNILKQAGFPVPEGYIITTEEFDNFMQDNNINYTTNQYLAFNTEIQEKIINGKLPEKLKSELSSLIVQMKNNGSNKFVVRSSAICEDSETFSMAGMFESYINLSSFSDIEEALKKCYASLYSDRILDFIFDNEISFDNLKMAVVLQEYIPGEISGVTFTADTINMDSNIAHINAISGECSNFVSGMAKSQNYKVNKTTKEYTLGNENGSILEEAKLKELLDISLKIEKTMGYFQDIEWTSSNDKIYILQTRPITTFKIQGIDPWKNIDNPNSTWDRLYDKPLTPLMQDIVNTEVTSFSKGAARTVFRLDIYGEGQIINGFYYIRQKELDNKDTRRKAFVDEVNNLFDEGKNIYEDVILPEILAIINKIETLEENGLDNNNINNLLEYLKLSIEYLNFTLENHWPAVHGNMYIDIFQEYIKKILPQIDTENYYDLIWNESKLAKERRNLIEMADLVKGNDKLLNLFDNSPYDMILYEKINKLDAGKELIEKIKQHQQEYKYCDAGMDYILHPTMGERPDYVISGIRDMLSINSQKFYASINKTKENKLRLITEIESKLSSSEIINFRKELKKAESSFLANDNHNYYMERMYRGFLWYAVKNAAKVLFSQGVINSEKDIYYLHINEIYELLANPVSPATLINDRKVLYTEQLNLLAPEILGLIPNEQIGSYQMADSSIEKEEQIIIKATSGLNKKVKGKIVRGIPKTIEENSIILLPHCHFEGLLRILGKVKGLIFNWGSPYDHLGIIAREMNIPAMYNAYNSIDLLKDGDMVELDGVNGTITKLK